MDGLRFLVLSALVLSASVCHGASLNTNETEAQQFLDDYNAAAIDDYYISSEASWALDTNITEYNTQKMLTNVSAQLESIYAKAKVCLSSDNCVSLEPDLTRIMAKSRNYTELTTVWKKWRDVSGKVMPQLYSEYVDLNNDAVKLLGNMWAQEWNERIDILKPFKDKDSMDVTEELKRQCFPFWYSNLCLIFIFRIKMCTDVTHEDLMTIHHEMGHIQYYLQYQNQSVLFRTGANPGFHEAVGDVMALSVGTPEHLRTIGLYKNQDNDEETDLNFLLNMALQKVAFLPFGYLIDQWRWSVFRGDTTPESYNEDWWSLRCKYQGVSPPVRRQDTDFDPGAKYHVASGTPYIR
ncbi:angiotensin-converting enzyme-like [Aplysia californica]|uniref:Angiotensin-converting enzyme-like n=1 Tax=Aplysia californica TaxID=6500 RepID=A0ABM1VZD2_APLCA|nr:angiotensin-converting enzyme-like [Aplysia californica]